MLLKVFSNTYTLQGTHNMDQSIKSLKQTLKVSQSQKQISNFSFEPKNQQNFFLISAYKNGSNKKSEGTLLY